MQKPSSGNVQKKASSEIFFAEYGKNRLDGEDPTPENKRVIDLYEPVDAMSLNREKDRVVVSGIRGVLQIIKIQKTGTGENEAPSIVKEMDMRVYRKGKVNILYSAQNVKWNQLYDQYIATTSSNGSIVCWNISRKNKSVFKAHERSATCLDWHASAPYILVSGSRDCTVRSYDMRVKEQHPQLTFDCYSDRNCESIRDIAMCKAPGFDDYFFTGDDGGVLRLWDLRQTKRWVLQKVAHRSFVSTLSMNPHNRRLIATGGGRDKMVKIWEWTGPELNRVSVVETTAPLGRLAWRPDKPYHLATCASVNETTVHVWDVRRPYLPYVTYDEHRDAVTDACWPTNDFDVFMTCGKDGLVVLHNIDSGHAPVSFACDVAFDITPDGTLGLAVNSEIHAKNDAEEAAINAAMAGKKALRKIPYESFRKPIKSLIGFGIPQALTHSLPPTTFHNIAQKYIIGGVEIVQLCETNSKIARKNGLEHVAQTWRLVEALCEQAKIQEEYDKQSAEEKARIVRAWAVRRKELAEEGRRWLANLNDLYKDDIKKQVTQRLENTQHVTAFLKFSSSSESENASENEEDENNKEAIDRMAPNFDVLKKTNKRRKKKTAAPTDFYFGAGEGNYKIGNREKIHANEFMGLGPEAYELRDEEKERRFFCKAAKQPTNAEEYDALQREMEDHEADFQKWSPMLEIYRLLLYHAEQGDMQTCATISMVCGKRLLDAVDHYTINGWIKCYMEMLYSLELFLVMAKIRKYCTLDSISSVSRENTTIQLAHAECDALIVNGRCTKCEAVAQADCTLCRFPIVGLTFQCHVCGHCMHADHAYEWFQKTNICGFVGCPCTCGKNTWPDMERTFIGNDEVMRDHRKFEPDPRDWFDDEGIPEEERPNLPKADNRVDASRLDSDSEPSDDDLEWSPRNSKIKTKYDNKPHNSRNVNILVKMCALRKKESEELTPLDTRPRQTQMIEEDEDFSEMFTQDNQKEEDGLLLRETLEESAEKLNIERDLILENDPEKKKSIPIDRSSLMATYLIPPEPDRGLRKRPRSPEMETIRESDEDLSASDDSEDELMRKRQRRILVENATEERVNFLWLKASGYVEEEDWEAKGCYIHDRWTDLYGKDYIKSIGPIGVQSYQLEFCDKPDEEDNMRSISPTLAVATRNHLKELLTSSGYYDSSDDDEEDEEKTEEEKADVPEKVSTFGERALQVLNMSKHELKKRKAKKRKKNVDKIYSNIFSDSNVENLSSSDEFDVSSNDVTSSESSSTSDGFEAESEGGLSDSSCLEAEFESELEESEESEETEESEENEEEVPIRLSKRHTKHLNPVTFPFPRPLQDSSKFVLIRDVADRMPIPPSFSPQLSPASSVDSCPISETSSSSHYESPPPTPPPPPPQPPKPRVIPSYRFRLNSEEEREAIRKYEEMVEARRKEKEEPDDEELSRPEKHVEEEVQVVEGKVEEVEEITPSRKSSSTVSPAVSTVSPESEHPITTSCINPVFTQINGRPPPSQPVFINGNGERPAIESTHSAPGAHSVMNPLFENRSSLPNRHLTVNGYTPLDAESGPSSRKSSTSSIKSKLVAPSPSPLNSESMNSRKNSLIFLESRHSEVNEVEEEFKTPLNFESLNSRANSQLSLGSHHSEVDGIEMKEEDEEDEEEEEEEVVEEFKTCQDHQSSPYPREHIETSSDSDLFSTDEEGAEIEPEDGDDEPFFPITEDIPRSLSTKHPWETEEQYRNRLRDEREEEKAEERKEIPKEKDQEGEKAKKELKARIAKNTKQLTKKKRRERLRKLKSVYRDPKPVEPLKRVKFTFEDRDASLKKAMEILKEDNPDYKSEEEEEEEDSDFEAYKTEKLYCEPCKGCVAQEVAERQYAKYLKDVTEEGQMFFCKSLTDPCAIFQLRHLDTCITDVTLAKRTAKYLVEFIKIFYFIEWNELVKPDNEFVLKEVYELWNDFRIKRRRVCRDHFRDYKFKFFASSIATKMKQHLLMDEDPQLKQAQLSYDWVHLKACTNTIEDAAELVDDAMDCLVLRNPHWTIEERKVANRYWDMFGEIPVHVVTSNSKPVPPASEDLLEIIDDSNYFTKKMLMNAARNSRSYDIRLSYTKRKKNLDMFHVQDRSRETLNREWQMRLEKMVNEVRNVDFSKSSFKINPYDKLIYTTDAHHPYPIVQFDTGTHYVTVQPMISRRYIDFKSHLRRKFTFRRAHRIDREAGIEITTEKLRKLPSFKKFQPKLQRAKEYKEMMAQRYKVVDRTIVETRKHLNTIMEEEEEVDMIVELLKNRPDEEKIQRKPIQAEDVFGERRDQWDLRDDVKLGKRNSRRYRKEIVDFEKHEADKMNIMRKHWMPELRKKIFVARKILEIGRIMLEQEVQQWMEFQYNLRFTRKTLRKRFKISQKRMWETVSTGYRDSVLKMDFTEPLPPPSYNKPLAPVARFKYTPGPPAINSSSDEDDYDYGDPLPKERAFVTFETQPELHEVAGRLQSWYKKRVDAEDALADHEWEYSDDSSISDWFDNDTDDMVNRLANVDYVDEHLILKERMKGALGRKLYEVKEEREKSEPSSDDEMYEPHESVLRAKWRKGEEANLKRMEDDPRNIGNSDGKKRQALKEMEAEMDKKLAMKRAERKNEMEQLRWHFKKFTLEHTYTSPPYAWNEDLHAAIACLHQNELRRVSNRIHQQMKEEYENEAEKEEMIVNTIPLDETSLEYKLINFLLFRKDGESYLSSIDRVTDARKVLRPIQRYENFFGKEVFYKVAALSRKALTDHHIRTSFAQIIRRYGDNLTIESDRLRRFYKLWWYHSAQTLQQFIASWDEWLETDELIDHGVTFCNLTENLDLAQQTYEKLELGFIMNEMLFLVEQYVEETQNLFERSQDVKEKIFYSTMDFDQWDRWRNADSRDEEFWIDVPEKRRKRLSSISSTSTPEELEEEEEEEEEEKEKVLEDGYQTFLALFPLESTVEETETWQSLEEEVRMEPYWKVLQELQEYEEEKQQKTAEEACLDKLAHWTEKELSSQWGAEDIDKRIHDFLMMDLAVYGERDPIAKSWKDVLEDKERYRDEPGRGVLDLPGLTSEDVLEICGLPVGLDNQMFNVTKIEFQEEREESVSDASEIAERIERGFEDDIQDDAQSYSSVRHVAKHELHFQRELESRIIPSCVVIFSPEIFFEDSKDIHRDFKKWKQIIEASECPFSFNRLIMRERLLQKCRDRCQEALLNKYFQPDEKSNRSKILEVFDRCLILVVVSSELEPMDCRVISFDDLSAPAYDRTSYIKRLMVQESQIRLQEWLELYKIDMEVYSRCPVITVPDENLTIAHAFQLSEVFVEEYIKDDWLVITREEGIKALDTIIRMPPPPAVKLNAYKMIFEPIYNTWYHVWKFENAQAHSRTRIARKFDPVKEYLHKARMIVNYAHQHYRMKRFDSLMSKDPTEFQLVDRSDVPSASLFDSLDAAVSKFCNEDSPHLDDKSRQVVKDTLIQLATGKIPYFTANYFGGYDYSQSLEATSHEDEEKNDEKMTLLRNTEVQSSEVANANCLELDDCQEEMDWLRGMYEESDFQRRRFMAVMCFEIAQKALFKFAPGIADFEKAQKRFEHLLTLHGKQRPLLDMMLTKVRGTYFMPLETNMFLYHTKLITFGELGDSEIHPKDWKNRKITFEDYRRQGPISPYAMADFIDVNNCWEEGSDSGSEIKSDTSSSLGGSRESLSSSKRAKQARKAYTRARRDMMMNEQLQSRPTNPDEAFWMEKRALGPKQWKLRRKINEYLEPIIHMDRNKVMAKLPNKKHDLVKYIQELIVHNAEAAHWSWGPLKMRTKIGRIPPVNRMKPKHFNRIAKGKKMYKPPKKYDAKDLLTSGRKWF